MATKCHYFCNYAEAWLKRGDYFRNYVIISLGKEEVMKLICIMHFVFVQSYCVVIISLVFYIFTFCHVLCIFIICHESSDLLAVISDEE